MMILNTVTICKYDEDDDGNNGDDDMDAVENKWWRGG